MTGKDKAAILLIALGQEISKEVFKHLEGKEIEELYLLIFPIASIAIMNLSVLMLYSGFTPVFLSV